MRIIVKTSIALIIATMIVAARPQQIFAQNTKRQIAAMSSDGVRATLFEEAEAALKIAQEQEATLLAPEAFAMGLLSYQQAEIKFQQGGKLEEIRAHLREAIRHFQRAVAATNLAGQTFSITLTARDDARHAEAPAYAANLWQQTEARLKKAARTLEKGNLKSAMKQASAIEKQYRQAELEAIQRHPQPNWRSLSSSVDEQRSSIVKLEQEATASQARVTSLQQKVATLEKTVTGNHTNGVAANGTQSAPAVKVEIDPALQTYFSRNDALVFKQDREVIIRLFNLDFFADTARLSAANVETLQRVREVLRKFPRAGITVAGHVYTAGNQRENLKHSRERAESVKRYLIENLFVSQPLVAMGFGDTVPIPKYELFEGQIKNERIDVIVELAPSQMSFLYRR